MYASKLEGTVVSNVVDLLWSQLNALVQDVCPSEDKVFLEDEEGLKDKNCNNSQTVPEEQEGVNEEATEPATESVAIEDMAPVKGTVI